MITSFFKIYSHKLEKIITGCLQLDIMAAEDYIKQKKEIVEKYQSTIFDKRSKIDTDILVLMDKALKDGQLSVKVHGSILDKIKLGGQLEQEASKGMDGAQRLEFSKLYFDNIKYVMDTITNDLKISGYESLIKNIDDQLLLITEEMKNMDKELKEVEKKWVYVDCWRIVNLKLFLNRLFFV